MTTMNNQYQALKIAEDDQAIIDILNQAEQLGTPIIMPDALAKIIEIIKQESLDNVLEIGSAIGYSAIMMAKYGAVEVLTIERDEDSYSLAKSNIEKTGLTDKITLVLANALDYELPEDYRCDLLFIDAAKSQYIKFFEKFSQYLKPNALIVADNLLFHGLVENPDLINSKNQRSLVRKIRSFREYLENHPDYDTTFYDLGDGLSISRKKGE